MVLVTAASGCSWLVDTAGLESERDGGAPVDAPRSDADGVALEAGALDSRAGQDALLDAADAPDDATSCAADLMTSTNHCGRCGHDCAGGSCLAGRCQPIELSSSEVDLEELRILGDRLLYRAQGHVRSLGVDGGLPVLLQFCANRTGLAVTDAGFYSWCDTSVTLRDVGDAGLRGVSTLDGYHALSGGDWFFHRQNNQALSRAPAMLGDAGFSDLAYSVSGYRSLAATATQLFYMTGDGVLFYTPLASGPGTELERNQSAPGGIAVDDTAVFWLAQTDTSNAVLRSRSFTAGASTTLATALDHPNAVAIDATHAYVTAAGTPPAYTNGAIVRVPRAGGAAEIVAEGLLRPHEILVTDRFVIWTSRGTPNNGGFAGGAIFRLAK